MCNLSNVQWDMVLLVGSESCLHNKYETVLQQAMFSGRLLLLVLTILCLITCPLLYWATLYAYVTHSIRTKVLLSKQVYATLYYLNLEME